MQIYYAISCGGRAGPYPCALGVAPVGLRLCPEGQSDQDRQGQVVGTWASCQGKPHTACPKLLLTELALS